MELTDQIKEFLEKSTKTQDLPENHAKDSEWMQTFTTERDSKVAMNKWRESLDMKSLRVIQSECSQMMDLYRKVGLFSTGSATGNKFINLSKKI